MANVSSSNGLEKRPKLRFPGFDEPWQTTLLSSVFAKNTQKNTDGRITNVICNSAKQGLIPQREYFDKNIANSDNTNGYYIIEENDFVYNPRKSADAPYGPISSYKYTEAGIVSPLYLCFRAKKEINPAFFEWYFRSSAWHRYVYMSGDSGARHDRVSIKDDTFFAMPINIPSAHEQAQIAIFLERIEQRIEMQRALVDSLKKYKRGLIKLVFEKVMSEAHYQLPLSDLCISISSGRTTVNESNGRYPLFGSTGIVGMTNTIEHDGDIVMVARVGANAGKVNFFSGRCGVTDNTLVIRVKENTIHPMFLAYFLENFDLHKLIFGSGQPLVTGGQLKKIQSPVIAYKTQLLITRSLESLDRIIGTQDTYMEKLIQLKSGLMQRLFI